MAQIHHKAIVPLALFGLVLGCAQLGGIGGGDSNLPNRGIVPYVVLEAGEPPSPYVLPSRLDENIRYLEPYGLVVDDTVYLYVEERNLDTGDSTIVLATSTDKGVSFSEPQPVLTTSDEALLPLAGPSLSCGADTCLMALGYGNGEGFLFAEGPAEGPFTIVDKWTFEITEDYEQDGVASPSIIPHGDGYAVYYHSRADADSPYVIARADLAETVTKVGVVLEGECPEDAALFDCWEPDGVQHPDVRISTTAGGQTLVRMMYRGRLGTSGSFGFAASEDGLLFVKFFANPIFESEQTIFHPTNVQLDDRYLLFFTRSAPGNSHGVALAINADGKPSEGF
ncbi:MAG: hypothetical protein CMH54_05210 [Myxococcales bacterium]|nr:hypothetical protein [Myxococcales bacterium]|tara:strand:+ start:415 stop:1431 length:1017 start_codon:yes stop_codon:yes gene_type:complete